MGSLSRSLFGRLISFDLSLSTRLVTAHTIQELVGGPRYIHRIVPAVQSVDHLSDYE